MKNVPFVIGLIILTTLSTARAEYYVVYERHPCTQTTVYKTVNNYYVKDRYIYKKPVKPSTIQLSKIPKENVTITNVISAKVTTVKKPIVIHHKHHKRHYAKYHDCDCYPPLTLDRRYEYVQPGNGCSPPFSTYDPTYEDMRTGDDMRAELQIN